VSRCPLGSRHDINPDVQVLRSEAPKPAPAAQVTAAGWDMASVSRQVAASASDSGEASPDPRKAARKAERMRKMSEWGKPGSFPTVNDLDALEAQLQIDL
jgi:hypothetical protein